MCEQRIVKRDIFHDVIVTSSVQLWETLGRLTNGRFELTITRPEGRWPNPVTHQASLAWLDRNRLFPEGKAKREVIINGWAERSG